VNSPTILKEAAMLEVTRHIPRSAETDRDALRAGMRVAALASEGSLLSARAFARH